LQWIKTDIAKFHVLMIFKTTKVMAKSAIDRIF